jgi:hypothetical protein
MLKKGGGILILKVVVGYSSYSKPPNKSLHQLVRTLPLKASWPEMFGSVQYRT